MYTLILVGLCLPEANGVSSGSPCLGCGGCVGGLEGGLPSSSQPSGTAREADARAAARKTITLPRPGMGLRIWRRQSGEGEDVIPCNGASGKAHGPEHPCRTTDPASPPPPIASCSGQRGDHTAVTPSRTAGRVFSTVTAVEESPCLEGGCKGQTLTRTLWLHGLARQRAL